MNVKVVPTLDDKPVSEYRKSQLKVLKQFSIIPESDSSEEDDALCSIVIPLTDKLTPKSTDSFCKYPYRTGDLFTPIGYISTCEPFDFLLSFAMTFFKAQGRTIKRYVVDLTKRPHPFRQLTFASVMVALSRS